MKTRMFFTLIFSLLSLTALASPYIQDSSVMSCAQLTAAGGSCAQLIGTPKLWEPSLGEQLSTAIANGDICSVATPGLFSQQVTPANPAAGFDKFYPKADDKFYGLTSAGVEGLIGPIATEAGAAHNYLTGYNNGVFSKSQPACSDLSNGAASCSTDTTNAANISSGLLALARGGTHADLSATGGVHQFLKQSGAGSDITVGQPDFSDLSGQLGTAQLPASFDEVFIDYVSGNDANNGSVLAPWKTIQHTCNTITPTINVPVVIHLTGGNNDTDVGTITCPPNIIITSDYGIQITRPLVISGGVSNDGVTLNNIQLVSTFTWVRNDVSEIGLTLNNAGGFGLIDFEQQGAGVSGTVFNAFGLNTIFAGGLTIQAALTTLGNVGYVSGAVNYKDSGAATLYVSGADLFAANFALHGGMTADFFADFPEGGSTIVGTTTGSGTPAIFSDSSSIPSPASVTGAYTLSYKSIAPYVGYTPTTAGDWSSVPATVLAALDNLASTGVYKSQAANKFFASPNGAPGPMSPRSIVAADVPTLNQNTTGTAANLSGTPALPNGTTATTQAPGDNSTKLATTAYADAAAAGGGISSLTTDVVAAGPGAAVATIQPNVVTNAKLAQMPTLTLKGNNTGGTTNALDLTVAQVNTMLGTVTSLTGEATGSGPGATAVTLSNAAVIGKVLTGFVSGAGVVAATDTILQAFNKIVGNAAAYLSTTLNSGQIFVGSAGNIATGVAMSGGATISNTGVVSLTNASVTGQALTGFVSGAGTVAATDTILQGFNKLAGNQAGFLPTAGTGLVEVFTGNVITPSNDTFALDESAAFAYTVNSIIVKTVSGTDTLAVQKNGVSLTGCSAVSVSSVQATGTCTALNSVAIGDRLTFVTSADAAATRLTFTVKVTRQ